MRRLLGTFAAFLVGLLVLSGCATGDDAVSQGGEFTFVAPGGQTRIFYPPAERKRVPEMAGESLTEPGKTIRLSDYKGKVVVLNIWGAWCPPCRAEADDLQRVQDQTRAQGVQLLGIDVRDEVRSKPVDFVTDRGLTYPSIYDPPGRVLLALKNYPRSVVPSTIILDRQHRVAAVFLTEMLDTELLPAVRRVANEPA